MYYLHKYFYKGYLRLGLRYLTYARYCLRLAIWVEPCTKNNLANVSSSSLSSSSPMFPPPSSWSYRICKCWVMFMSLKSLFFKYITFPRSREKPEMHPPTKCHSNNVQEGLPRVNVLGFNVKQRGLTLTVWKCSVVCTMYHLNHLSWIKLWIDKNPLINEFMTVFEVSLWW